MWFYDRGIDLMFEEKINRINWEKFALISFLSASLLYVLLVQFPPYKQNKEISFYNPKMEKIDYAWEYDNSFVIYAIGYVFIVSIVAAIKMETNKKLDFLQLWDKIPYYYLVKFRLQSLNNMDFEKVFIKEYRDNRTQAFIETPEKGMIALEFNNQPTNNENPIIKLCTLDISMKSIQDLFKERMDTMEIFKRLDKLAEKDKSPITKEALIKILQKSKKEDKDEENEDE